MNCSICIEKVDKGFSLECGHCFHNKCITQWLLKNKTCPVCRKEIIKVKYTHTKTEPIVLVMDTFEDTIVPKNILESIKNDCDDEINAFLENITQGEWAILENDEYVLEMVTKKKGRGKHKTKEECRFSITLSIINNIYCFIIIIENYSVFVKPIMATENYIFKNIPYRNRNKNRNRNRF